EKEVAKAVEQAKEETVAKLSPPEGMHEKYVDTQGSTYYEYHWNPEIGKYNEVNPKTGNVDKGGGFSPDIIQHWVKECTVEKLFPKEAAPAAAQPPNGMAEEQAKPDPLGYDTIHEQHPEIFGIPNQSGIPNRPEGLPAAVKGPKGGVYKFNPQSQLYEHASGKYSLTQSQVKSYLQQGKYTEHDPNAPKPVGGAKAALAAKIPEGLHSEYIKKSMYSGKSAWHYKFNEQTGQYDYWNGNKTYAKLTQSPEKMLEKVTNWGSIKPVKGAVAGTGPKVEPTATVISKPVTSNPPTPAAPKAEFTYKNAGYDPSTGAKL